MTFLTDFGTNDTYVGQMKGVALGINPNLQLVDITHQIPPQSIIHGSIAWEQAVFAFPAGTIHVGIVDPGVGSNRRLIAAEIGDNCFVCPDNGLLTGVLQRTSVRRIVCLDKRQWWRPTVSNTFHGRDILVPIAAAWSLGHDLSEFGTVLATSPVTLPVNKVSRGRTSLVGQIIDIDRFGNLITNIESGDLPDQFDSIHFEIGAFQVAGLSKCYADTGTGEPIALIGSSGRLEVAIRNGNASEEIQAEYGRRVVVRWTVAQP